MTTGHEIIDESLYRAILHGVAAGACQAAARETGSAYWAGMAEDQRVKAQARLHQAASGRVSASDDSRPVNAADALMRRR